MILRKPYAFFIKYFKLLHAIIAGLVAFLLYRSFTIYNFFSAYVKNYSSALNEFSPRTFINMYSFLLALVIIIFIIILLSVMIYKKKPKALYIFSIFVYVAVLVLFFIVYPSLRDISAYMLDIRTSSAYRDLFLIISVLQLVCLVWYAIRATGFDIKQFDFGTDLQQLDIDEKDSEEIEVSLEFDQNQIHRNIRYKLRELRYFYGENKFVINTAGIILLIIIGFMIYTNIGIYTASYNQGESFSASGVVMNVRDTYLTQTDPAGNKLTDDMIVVVKVDIRKQGVVDRSLNTGLTTLIVNGISYGQNNDYAKELYDLGTAYAGQSLSDEFQSYILAFLIPKEDINKKMELKFNDNVSYVKGEMGAKNVYVHLKPINLTKNAGSQDGMIGKEMTFENSILEDSTFMIKGYEFNNKFKINYKYCYATDKCIDSYEYLTPTATGSYAKTLMRINGYFVADDSISGGEITSLQSFLNNFATINYKIGDVWYSNDINTQSVKPKVGVDNSNYYIEVPLEVANASEISLTFKIRNYTYKYVLK